LGMSWPRVSVPKTRVIPSKGGTVANAMGWLDQLSLAVDEADNKRTLTGARGSDVPTGRSFSV